MSNINTEPNEDGAGDDFSDTFIELGGGMVTIGEPVYGLIFSHPFSKRKFASIALSIEGAQVVHGPAASAVFENYEQSSKIIIYLDVMKGLETIELRDGEKVRSFSIAELMKGR